MDTPDQMQVSWTTSCKAGAVVNYGTSKSLGSSTTGAAPTTYSSPGYTSPYLYHVVLSGLTPNSTYYYTVGDATSGVSSIMTFDSHPGADIGAKNVDGSDITFGIIGDLGGWGGGVGGRMEEMHADRRLVDGLRHLVVGRTLHPNSFLFLPPGQTSNSASTIAHVEGQPGITTIVHVGDLSYAGARVGGGAHAGRACAEVLAAAV